MRSILGSSAPSYLIVAPIAGVVIDKWGIRKSLLTGIIVIGLSALLQCFATGFLTTFSFVALFGLGGSMVSLGYPKIISLWFKGRSLSIAIGVYMNRSWLGALIAFLLLFQLPCLLWHQG
jgi:MFS family permease